MDIFIDHVLQMDIFINHVQLMDIFINHFHKSCTSDGRFHKPFTSDGHFHRWCTSDGHFHRSCTSNEWGNSTTSRSLISYPKAHSVSEREESRVNEQGFLLRINKHGEYWRRGNARSFTANARSFRTNEWGNSTTSRSLISYPKAHSVSEREESRVNEQGFLLWINKHGEYWSRGNARSFTANARSFRTNEWGNSTTSRSLISYPKAHRC